LPRRQSLLAGVAIPAHTVHDGCRRSPSASPTPCAVRPYAMLSDAAILRIASPPLADQAVLILRRWRRCSGTRATLRALGRRCSVPRRLHGRPELRDELRGEIVQVVGKRVDGRHCAAYRGADVVLTSQSSYICWAGRELHAARTQRPLPRFEALRGAV